jgi:hypothetical protein
MRTHLALEVARARTHTHTPAGVLSAPGDYQPAPTLSQQLSKATVHHSKEAVKQQ